MRRLPNMRRAFTSMTTDAMHFQTLGEGSYNEYNEWEEGTLSKLTPFSGFMAHFNDRDLLFDGSAGNSTTSPDGDGLEWKRINAKLTTTQQLKINDRVHYKGINYKVVNFRDYSSAGFYTYLCTSHEP